jgi:uncharacterized protein (DUF3820 family)
MNNDIIVKLQAPFKSEEIEWRVDRGLKTTDGNYVYVLAYVQNRAIMNRLDEVFGPFGWMNKFREWKEGNQICTISVFDSEKGIWIDKEDGSDNSNMEAVKGGLSNSMKRAAVQWGIGRYLYNLEQHKVPLNKNGQHYANVKVKNDGRDEYIKGYWDEPNLPDWALPEEERGKQKPKPTPISETKSTEGGSGLTPQQAGEVIIPSGKHKGKKINQAPEEWVEWCSKEGYDPKLKAVCALYLAEKRKTQPIAS